MLERGLLPDFSPAALAELTALDGRSAGTPPATRDLRDRLGGAGAIDVRERFAIPRMADELDDVYTRGRA